MKRLVAIQSADYSSGADITSVKVAPVNESLAGLVGSNATQIVYASKVSIYCDCMFFLASLQNFQKLLLTSKSLLVTGCTNKLNILTIVRSFHTVFMCFVLV
jgi:hypothetical protein